MLTDLSGVSVLAFESESSIARDHEAVADTGESGGEILSDAIGEIVLIWITREVRERQHHNGKMRRSVRGDSRRSARTKEVPRTHGHYDE